MRFDAIRCDDDCGERRCAHSSGARSGIEKRVKIVESTRSRPFEDGGCSTRSAVRTRAPPNDDTPAARFVDASHLGACALGTPLPVAPASRKKKRSRHPLSAKTEKCCERRCFDIFDCWHEIGNSRVRTSDAHKGIGLPEEVHAATWLATPCQP
jgi:hypothetical protein